MINPSSLLYRKQVNQNERQSAYLDSDDDESEHEDDRSTGKSQPRRSLAIQSGHKVLLVLIFSYNCICNYITPPVFKLVFSTFLFLGGKINP